MSNQGPRTVISRGTVVLGGVLFEGDLLVAGRVCGNVDVAGDSDACVEIVKEGVVEGDVRAGRVSVDGRILGNVMATDRVDVLAGAYVSGDILYGTIEMHLGAVVEGQLIRHEPEHAGNVVVLKSAASTGE